MRNLTMKRRSRISARRLAPVLLCGAMVLAGCGLGTGGGFSPTQELAGPLAEVPRLDGAKIPVGSKNFSEQLLLGKIAVITLQSAGATVQDYTNIPGSSSARQALIEGQTKMQWEYTGTAWIAYLGNDKPIEDPRKQYEAVRDADAKLGLTWLEPAPMNNTYSFAIPEEKAKELNITTMSQVKDVPKKDQTFCVESEFNNRSDGFQPWLKTYGITGVESDQIKVLDTGAIYEATDRGLCTFGEVFTTDGRLKALGLDVLEDDKNFFPNYNVAPVFTTEVIEQYPQLRELFAPISEALTTETLVELNAKIDVEGREPVDVANAWLLNEGFLQVPS